MTSSQVVVAVDIGTSAVRAAAFTPAGNLIAFTRRKRVGVTMAIFDPDALVADALAALRDLVRALDSRSVTALACSGHVGTVFVDVAGNPYPDAGSWSDDRGVALLAAQWPERHGAFHATGRPFATASALALACWLRSTAPERHRRVVFVLSPKDYLVFRLTGSIATDWTSACYTLGFDVRRRCWASGLLGVGGLALAQMPEPVSATAIAGRLNSAAAKVSGLPQGLPIAAGGPDGSLGVAAGIGSRTGVVMDVAGSTDVLAILVCEPPEPPPGAAILNSYLVEGLWSVGGPTGATGAGADRIVQLSGFDSIDSAITDIGTDIMAIPPGSDGLIAVPLLTGSRFPTWNPDERAGIHGLSPHHGRAHLARAALEGAAFVVREGIDAIASRSVSVAMAGGTARSDLVCQLRCDVLGRQLAVYEQTEISVLGAGAAAAAAIGLYPSLSDAVEALRPPARTYLPDPQQQALYDAAYEQWARARAGESRRILRTLMTGRARQKAIHYRSAARA